MKTVFFDIDTQIDFLFPAGALYVPRAERLLPNLEKLTRHATAQGITVVSTADTHAENDPEFQHWPPHCVSGTAGQQKVACTLMEGRVVVPATGPEATFPKSRQIIVQKQRIDLMNDANLLANLEHLNADKYVVYGVVTEYCVESAAMGLLRLGKKVELVTDAIQSLSAEKEKLVFEAFQASGGRFTTVQEVCAA